jgi:serine/threonine-protein kinase
MPTCPKCGNRFQSNVGFCPNDGTALEEPRTLLREPIGNVLADKYRIEGLLKRGGMGAVYRGTHLMLQKTVAIKLIKPELVTSEDTIRRFHREARAASQLDHPNIVTVYDLGQAEDGTLYIAMELVPGTSLKELVKKEGPLQPERALRLAKSIASALALAHRNQIIHRDLKPQNIMVSEDSEGREQPKLLDFGIAKTFESEGPALTSTGLVLGTPHYMSPEQAKGTAVDNRSDLYALGIILYEMLVGKVPFDDKSIPAILVKHLNEMPRPLSQLRPGLDPALEAIVLRCLEKEPANRYQSAEGLSEALSAAESVLGAASGEPHLPPIPVKAPAELPRTMAGAKPTTQGVSAPDRRTQPTVRVAEPPTTRAVSRSRNKGLAIAVGVAVLLLLAIAVVAGLRGIASFFDGESKTATPSAQSEQVPPGTPAVAPIDSPPKEVPATPDVGSAAEDVPRTAEREIELPTAVSPSSGTPTPLEPAVPRPVEPEAAPLPANPPVHVRCEGLSDACASLQSELQRAFDKAGLPLAAATDAEILLSLYTEEIESRTEDQFGTTFVVRTYSMEASADAPRFGDMVGMPPPTPSPKESADIGRSARIENTKP